MEKDSIEKTVRGIINRLLGVNYDEITPGAKLIDDLGADSIDMCEILMEAEEVFDIDVDDETAETVVTVGDAINLAVKLAS